MKRTFVTALLSTAILAPLSISTDSAQATTITFDEFRNRSGISSDSFRDSGVVFDTGLLIWGEPPAGLLPSSFPNVAYTGAKHSQLVNGFFTKEVDFVSVFAGNHWGDPMRITLVGFDRDDKRVDSDNFQGRSGQTLSISGAGIVRFKIYSNDQLAILGLDDFTFNPSDKPGLDAFPAPEPLTILGAGTAIGFGTAFKRKLAHKKENKA